MSLYTTSSNNNYVTPFTLSEVNLDDKAENFTIVDKKTRAKLQNKQDDQKAQNNKHELKMAMSRLSAIHEQIGSPMAHSTQQDRLARMHQEINSLSAALLKAQINNKLDSSLVDDIHNWSQSAAETTGKPVTEDNFLETLENQIALINKALELVVETNAHAKNPIPLSSELIKKIKNSVTKDEENETNSHTETSANISEEEESLTHQINKALVSEENLASNILLSNRYNDTSNSSHDDNDDSNTNFAPIAPRKPAHKKYGIDQDHNIYLISLNLVLCTQTMVMNAVSTETMFNDILQKMQKDLNDFLSLLATVNKAFKDALAQASAENDTNKAINLGWETQVTNHDNKQINVYDLLTAEKLDKDQHVISGTPAFPQWQNGNVIRDNGFPVPYDKDDPNGNAKIAFCFCDESKSQAGTLLTQFGTKIGAKWYMNENQIFTALKSFGGRMEKFTGGNLATLNAGAFKTQTGLDGLTNAITSSITNLQSQSTASVSRLGICNQNLVSSISNYITLISNLLSGMMKLEAIS